MPDNGFVNPGQRYIAVKRKDGYYVTTCMDARAVATTQGWKHFLKYLGNTNPRNLGGGVITESRSVFGWGMCYDTEMSTSGSMQLPINSTIAKLIGYHTDGKPIYAYACCPGIPADEIEVICCDGFGLPTTLNATVTGCVSGSFELAYDAETNLEGCEGGSWMATYDFGTCIIDFIFSCCSETFQLHVLGGACGTTGTVASCDPLSVTFDAGGLAACLESQGCCGPGEEITVVVTE